MPEIPKVPQSAEVGLDKPSELAQNQPKRKDKKPKNPEPLEEPVDNYQMETFQAREIAGQNKAKDDKSK